MCVGGKGFGRLDEAGERSSEGDGARRGKRGEARVKQSMAESRCRYHEAPSLGPSTATGEGGGGEDGRFCCRSLDGGCR